MNNTDVAKMAYILKNPSNYIIVKDDSTIPKQQMTREAFNSLSTDRQRAVLAANQIVIVD